MTRRYALRDHQWERIKNLLPGREGYVEVTAKDNRLFVEAVLYRYRADIPAARLTGTVSSSTAPSPSTATSTATSPSPSTFPSTSPESSTSN